MLRPYEVMYILRPTLSEEERAALVTRFNDLITSLGGSVEEADQWPLRRLAYEVSGAREGYYVVVKFQGDPPMAQEMDRQMKLTEALLRQMILRRDD